ncbi:NACHT and WD repeat domain-containing protein [Solwaraspora sp. WMMB335]|uniref:NACHT and WD repeat domain-containing protein n=1 Tax=Solwaraspora sp. WMMB335 TaxID=3404118 RepID=UPI003B946402
MGPRWQLAPGAVAAGRDITGTVHTGPTYVQVTVGRFDRLNDAIFDPAPLYEQLDLARFQGRSGLISQIDKRIAATDRGYVVVRGEAGVGKSALAAHLVWTRPCAHHFTRLDGGARNPIEARKSLAAQLIGAWGLADRFTPGDVFPAAAQRPDWLAKVIRAAVAARDERFAPAERRPVVLVVDGLDEAEADPAGMGTGIPLGLPAPDALPAGAYIVATSRYGIPLVALRDPLRVGWSQIEVEGADNLADMAAYLHAATTGPTPDPALTKVLAERWVPATTFVATLLDRCRGVWIYLRYVLDEVRAGLRPPNDVLCLPDGLRGYYELQIQQRWATQPNWRSLHLPALAVLAALGRPIDRNGLATLLHRPDAGNELAVWLDGPARAFLDVTTGPDRHRQYQVRHQSLRDLFTAALDGGNEEPIDGGLTDELHAALQTAHRTITTWLVPPASPATGRRDWSDVDDYTRLRLPTHAAAAGMLDELMPDSGFLLSCPPSQILPHRHTLSAPDAIAAVAALESASTSEWNDWSDGRRAWWLHVWARKTRSTGLAGALIADYSEWPWYAQTAIWSGTTFRTLTGHIGRVNAVAVLPGSDGRSRIVSGGDRSVRVWDPDTGEQLVEFAGHTGWVGAVAVLPGSDGRHLIVSGGGDAFGGGDGSVRVWDPDTGEQLVEFAGHTGGVGAVAVLPGSDGRHLIVSGGGVDGSVRVWDPDTGEQLVELTGHIGGVGAVAVLPGSDGRHLIVSGGNGFVDGWVRVWDPDTGEQLVELTGHIGWVRAVAVLPGSDGRHLIVSGGNGFVDGWVRVWDPDTGEQLVEFAGHTGWVGAVAVLPGSDGRHLIVSGRDESRGGDGSVRVWDPDTGEQLAELTGHTGGVSAVAVLPGPDGRSRIVSGGVDGSVRVWDPSFSRQLAELMGHIGGVSAVAVLPGSDGQSRIVSGGGGGDGSVRVWDPDTGEQLAELTGHTGGVRAVAVLPGSDGQSRIVSGGNESRGGDGSVRVWDPDTGEQLVELTGHIGWVGAVAVLPGSDGRHLIVSGGGGDAFGGGDGSVRVWDPDTGEQLVELTGHIGWVRAVAVLPGSDGRHLIVSGGGGDAFGGGDGSVRVWDPDTGEQLVELTGHIGGVRAVAVLPGSDGRHLIVSGDDRSVRVWDPDTGEQLVELTGHTGWVSAVAVLPGSDGRHLIVSGAGGGYGFGGGDGSVRVWDPDTGEQLAELTGHTGWVSAVAVLPRPDGRHLIVSGGDDRSVMVFVQNTEKPHDLRE